MRWKLKNNELPWHPSGRKYQWISNRDALACTRKERVLAWGITDIKLLLPAWVVTTTVACADCAP